MKRLALACSASVLALACGPGSTPDGSGGADASAAGGADGGSATGGASSGGGSDAGGGGANPSGGSPTGGTGGATGGQQGSTGGSGSMEPGSALDRYLQAGQPKVLYLQQILGELADLDATFNPQMLAEDAACDWTVAGACAMSEGCISPATPALDAGTMTLASAGDTLVSERVEDDYESTAGFFDETLVGGEPLVLSAAGGADLPAFELETTFPLVILIDSPAGDLTAPIPVPTTTDLTLEFRRAAGSVVLLLRGSVGSLETRREVVCAGAGDPGSLVVPAAALAYLGSGVEIDLYTTALESVVAGDRTVNFTILAGTSNDGRELLYKLVTQ